MIWKSIVAAAFLLALPAQADNTGKQGDVVEEHSDRYVLCVSITLDQLSAFYGPKAGEDAQDLGRRWMRIVSQVCRGTWIPRAAEMRAIYDDETRSALYLDILGMTMRQVVYFRARQEF